MNNLSHFLIGLRLAEHLLVLVQDHAQVLVVASSGAADPETARVLVPFLHLEHILVRQEPYFRLFPVAITLPDHVKEATRGLAIDSDAALVPPEIPLRQASHRQQREHVSCVELVRVLENSGLAVPLPDGTEPFNCDVSAVGRYCADLSCLGVQPLHQGFFEEVRADRESVRGGCPR